MKKYVNLKYFFIIASLFDRVIDKLPQRYTNGKRKIS